MTQPQPIYRKDYESSAYLIHTTELNFALSEHETIVSSKIDFYQNPANKNPNSSLFLDGIDLELISIFLNGSIPDYKVSPEGLTLNDLPKRFILEVQTRIHPETNTSLSGLYKSSGNFCTQCEAHGFRQITYYLDRPDVLSVFTTHIQGSYDKYPILLSNGNLISHSNGKATWHDPMPKPCYLFALVAGNFAVLEDTFTTLSAKKVALKIYVEPHNINKTQFAMKALKRAFQWDEERFGLEYDLDIYMIVAVDDFNMGAMENKGLNVFNSDCILTHVKTATDKDFINIESIIGHEYFHNWTGNRVTCKDWFQLSLKEGLSVFRDQEFTADLHARSIKRIDDVDSLQVSQFAEDSGPMAHPVRPESYIEMNNFYTATVYEKGAEVIRMIHTFLGEKGFQKGMRLYFERFDGQAVTIDDFIGAMQDANVFDFSQFMHWYEQSGTPKLNISTIYNAHKKTYIATIEQSTPCDFFLPLKFALLDEKGNELLADTLIIKNKKQQFTFENIDSAPTPSWLREFSAPIKLNTDLTIEQMIFLVANDSDSFSCWDNAQKLWQYLILTPERIDLKLFFDAIKKVLITLNDKALISKLITLPSERLLHNQQTLIDVVDIHNKYTVAIQKIVTNLTPLLLEVYHSLNTNQPYDINPESVGRRALKNTCLFYLAKAGKLELVNAQFQTANCMNDKLSAFKILLNSENKYKANALQSFYQEFKNDVQVMDKYFSSQALSEICDINTVKNLTKHELFSFTPNRFLSVVASFTCNFVNFHQKSGYEFLTESIVKLNSINPQMGARLVSSYNHWRRFTPELKALQKQQLEKILSCKNLSKNIFEIAQTALK